MGRPQSSDSLARALLTAAYKLGYSVAGAIGGATMIEFLIAYVLTLLPNFSDNPKFRVVTNVLCYWPKSFYKSTLLWTFCETLPKDSGIVDVTSMSREAIFGSADKDGNPIKPAFAGKSIVIISELSAFLGSGWNMRDITNTMNVVMECQPVNRRLLKLAQTNSVRLQQQIRELENDQVFWNPKEGVMTYIPRVSVLAASRPLDSKSYAFLEQSGLLDRFHTLSHEFDEHEVTEDWHTHRKLDKEALECLKDFNEKIKHVKVRNLTMPSEEFMKPIYDDLESMVDDEIAANPKLRKEEILNPRTKGDAIREIVGHAFVRTVCENGFKDIDTLEYAEADREFIQQRLDHFIEIKVHPIFTEEHMGTMRKTRPRDEVKELVLQFLGDRKTKQRKEIDDYISQRMKVGKATISNALNDLLKEREICQQQYGFYKLKENCETCDSRPSCQWTAST